VSTKVLAFENRPRRHHWWQTHSSPSTIVQQHLPDGANVHARFLENRSRRQPNRFSFFVRLMPKSYYTILTKMFAPHRVVSEPPPHLIRSLALPTHRSKRLLARLSRFSTVYARYHRTARPTDRPAHRKTTELYTYDRLCICDAV